MKFASVALLAAVGLATAQFDGVPECGVKCISAGVERLGCSIDDTACSCKDENQSKLASDLEMVSCLTFGCHLNDLADIIAAGTKLCAEVTAASSASFTATSTSTSSGSAKASDVASNTPSSTTVAAGPQDAELNSGAGGRLAVEFASVFSVVLGLLM